MASLAVLYVIAIFSTLFWGKVQKRGEIAYFSILLAVCTTVLVVQIYGIIGLIILKIIIFIAVKYKVLLLKKVLLIIAGSFIPVIQWIIWIFIALLFIGSVMEFYETIFRWLQKKLCQIRDFFDRVYSIGAIGRCLVPLEAAIISSPTVYSVWAALEQFAVTPLGSAARTITCFVLVAWMYRSYRNETNRINRYRGEGMDYAYYDLLPGRESD